MRGHRDKKRLPMTDIIENVSHAMRGAALMFYILMSVRTFPERNENNFKKILFWSMVFLCALVAKDMMFLSRDIWENPYMCNISMLTDLLYVPVMALFFFEAVSPGWIRPARVIGMSFPTAAALVLYAIHPSESIVRITMAYIILFGLTVITIIMLATSKRENRIKGYFSDISDISVTWVWKALSTLLVSLLAWTVLMWKSTYMGDALYFLISICCWSYIYSLAVKYRVVEIPALPVSAREEAGQDADIAGDSKTASCDTNDSLMQKITECMESSEIYLNPRLTLPDLAAAVGTNRTYLSDFLNRSLHTSFYEYVNGFRARKAAEAIRDNPGKTFTEIAEMSGYNSLSTFYRSFTATIGMTPSKYRDKWLAKGRNFT